MNSCVTLQEAVLQDLGQITKLHYLGALRGRGNLDNRKGHCAKINLNGLCFREWLKPSLSPINGKNLTTHTVNTFYFKIKLVPEVTSKFSIGKALFQELH